MAINPARRGQRPRLRGETGSVEKMGEKWTGKIRWWGLVVAIIMFAGCSSMMYEQYLEEGTAALKKGDYEMALSSFEKALEAKETKEAGDLILGT
jgi:hypothetical protein